MKNHKDLDIWKMSMDLVLDTYRLTKSFPKNEIYGLVTQMRRSSISIPSNIAEGASRNSGREFIRFLYIAMGSLSELETQFIIANRLSYIDRFSDYQTIILRIKRMIIALINSIIKRESKI